MAYPVNTTAQRAKNAALAISLAEFVTGYEVFWVMQEEDSVGWVFKLNAVNSLGQQYEIDVDLINTKVKATRL